MAWRILFLVAFDLVITTTTLEQNSNEDDSDKDEDGYDSTEELTGWQQMMHRNLIVYYLHHDRVSPTSH